MNFLEAVRALQNGECEKIESLVTGMPFIIHDYSGGVSCGRSSKPEEILGEWRLINPRPITEEVEVKLQVGIFPDGKLEYEPKVWNAEWPIVELTGHYTRPVPRKVKKREEITIRDNTPFLFNNRVPPLNAKLFAEWEEKEK